MKTLPDLVADATHIATSLAIVKKLAADLAKNVELAGKVLTARDLETIQSAYSQADMLETSRTLDAAIEDAKKHW